MKNIKKILAITLAAAIAIPYSKAYALTSDDAYREVTDAVTATGNTPMFGCRAPVGGDRVGSFFIYFDICEDPETGVLRHESSSEPSEDYFTYTDWYDTNKKLHYTYDKNEKRYVFYAGDDEELVTERLSLEYYLDPDVISKTALYTYGDDITIETREGSVECRTISSFEQTTVYRPIIIDSITKNDDSTLSDDYPAKTTATYNTYITFLIGKNDGLLYREEMKNVPVENGEEVSEGLTIAYNYYYPKTSLSIPTEYKKAVFASGQELTKSGVYYTSKYKSKKTVLTVSGYTKKSKKSIVIPNTIKLYGKSYRVTSIGKNAFKKMTGLKKITIGKNVTSIGKNAFSGCKKLKTIIVKNKKLKKKLRKNKWYKKRIK